MSVRFLNPLLLLGVLLLGHAPQQTQRRFCTASQYRTSMQRLYQRDYQAVALTLFSLAENGLAPVQFRLGLLYRLGLGVPRDPSLAEEWERKTRPARF